MKQYKTWLYIVGGIAIAAGIFFWLMQGGSVPKNTAKAPVVASHELRDTELHETVNGKRVWELQIGSLVYDKKRDTNILKNVRGKFYREDGSVLSLTSKSGEASMKTKDIILIDSVKGVLSTGGTVTADKMTWVNAKKLVIGEGHVKIVKDNVVATANKGTMDTGLEKLRLEGKAKVVKGAEQ